MNFSPPPPGHNRLSEDYLKTVDHCVPSFHFRTGKIPFLPTEVAPNSPSYSFGFPKPGPQSPTPAHATAQHYFVNDTTWTNIVDHGEFDDIVVGSGFCALAYVDEALKKDPWRKILILERGGFWLPEHFQNMPLPFKLILGGPSETFPWQLTYDTAASENKFMHGSCPFFGGRSTFWSAWCPRAIGKGFDLMRDFPQSLKDKASKDEFWVRCEKLLGVTPANEIGDPCFGQKLQQILQTKLDVAVEAGSIPTATRTTNAPLAVGRKRSVPNTIAFDKFSTPGPLLAIYERQRRLAKENRGHPLMIATDTVVERFELDPPMDEVPPSAQDSPRSPIVLHTSRGALCFPKKSTNIILAAGAFPATTILMNSAGDVLAGRAGSRVGGHYISHVAARFPLSCLPEDGHFKTLDHLQISAHYLAGKAENGLQYHVQTTAIHSPHPEDDAEDAARLCPDYAAAATVEQLRGSEEYVVLVCATLGELNEKNVQSWVRHNSKDPNVTTNIRLQVLPDELTESCRKTMEAATYEAIEVMAGPAASGKIEFWHDADVVQLPKDYDTTTVVQLAGAGWQAQRPPASKIRVPGLVHETSTLYMSDDLVADTGASVDSQYRPRGCKNVYVTGGALFPTSGSWNPTLAMCGFAQDLADQLYEKKMRKGREDK
ncbi:hypothetical protein CYLTODRAFT_368212 [Cylindrobasidium torrendii FP15055 ss-10]|uniref:Glucose-methanol-choline oxidoreductase C-terminal domain-containing protein n=1 Tax=Cylindrobasidium torrendii FP15055 ss-10 TaxID=1314674 RepID=A0A0D7BNM5_9AGAR|nr:hypothetical protein CYLTODRAFT_368212 [Cylindrobasidium torrendii FP15055 ss-10]